MKAILSCFRLSFVFWVTLGMAITATIAGGQVKGIATIQGTVTDSSGAAITGVAVTATSPALLVPSTTKTESDGTYRFVAIPVGTYTVRYEVNGFQTAIRDGIVLDVGFVAKVDISLTIGSVSQTVTVSGESPVVDTTTTTPVENFTSETLDVLPTTRTQYQILGMTPGVTMTGTSVDVGGSQLGTQMGYKNYGTVGQVTPEIEGINFRQDADAGGIFPDYYAYQEFQVQAAGMNAEVALPGAVWSGVVKSGGNDFHGDAVGAYEPGRFQDTNIDTYLRNHGVVGPGNKLNYIYDVFGDLGGRVIRDKLWFYGAWRQTSRSQHNNNFFSDSVLGPNGLQGNGISPIDNHPISDQTFKGTYQAAKNYKLIGFWMRNAKNLQCQSAENQQASPPFTPLASCNHLFYVPIQWKAELQGTPNDRIVYSVQLGHTFVNANWQSQPNTDVAGDPSEQDLFTGWYHGPLVQKHYHLIRARYQPSGNITFIPKGDYKGKHQFKAGFFIDLFNGGGPQEGACSSPGSTGAPYCSGNYLLQFNRVNGVVFQPFRIVTYNSPTLGTHIDFHNYSGYIEDQWQIGRHLTADLGVRIEKYHLYVLPSTQAAGQFTTGGAYPGVDVSTWISAAPRLGVAYDLTGSGKTVLKGSFGWYNWTTGDATFGGRFDRNATATTTYKWAGPCVVTQYTPCDASPATLAALTPTSPNYVSTTSPGTSIVNPSLTQPRTYEATGGFERELRPNLSLRVFYVFRKESNLYMVANPLRPIGCYNVAVSTHDPGLDGVLGTADDGSAALTLHDYNTAACGSLLSTTASEYEATPSANSSTFHTFEIEVNKRMSKRMGFLVSYSALKNHRWLIGSDNAAVIQTPDDLINPVDNTWESDAKVEFTYHLPAGFTFAALNLIQQGFGRQRTFLFANLPTLGSETVRLEPFGHFRLPTQNLLNVSLQKQFHVFGEGHRLLARLDIYNVLNTNAATGMNDQSGPSYGNVTAYISPLVARIGGEFHF